MLTLIIFSSYVVASAEANWNGNPNEVCRANGCLHSEITAWDPKTCRYYGRHFKRCIRSQAQGQCTGFVDQVCRPYRCERDEIPATDQQMCRTSGWNFKRCIRSQPCCKFGGAMCKASCSAGETQLTANKATCNRHGHVCCLGGATGGGVTAAPVTPRPVTPSPPLPSTSISSRQGACDVLALTHPGARLLGGAVARSGDWRWAARIYYKDRGGFCAGVLVGRDTVVTVAHCLYDQNGRISPSLLQVSLGDFVISQLDQGEEQFGVKSTQIDSGYKTGQRGRDFAIVKLDRSVTYGVTKLPACLRDKSIPLKQPQNCYTVGWGSHETGLGGPQRAAKVTVLDRTACSERITSVRNTTVTLPNDQLCAVSASSNPVAGCQFDDGDMLVCMDTGRRWALMGIMSEYSCDAQSKLPTIYTAISHYADSILKSMGR